MYSKQRGNSHGRGIISVVCDNRSFLEGRYILSWQRGRQFYPGFTDISLILTKGLEQPGFSGLNGDLKVCVICIPLWLLGQSSYFLAS